jgi:hypothetical protein
MKTQEADMSTWKEKLTAQWKDAANLVLGLWLAVSPWALSYAGDGIQAWNAHAVGVIVAVAALAALLAFQKWEEWVNAAFGAWLIVSPFVLSYATHAAALWNQVIVGLLVGILAVWTAVTMTDTGALSPKS